MRFMIADDSKISRNKLNNIITGLGYEVVIMAEDGEDAVNKFKEHKPSFITMDIEMPNKRGNVAALEILELDPNVNIILITSIVDKKELLSAIKFGVKKVLRKPVDKEKLEHAINELKSEEEI